MIIIAKSHQEIHTVTLQEGVDYQASDLIPGITGAERELPAYLLHRIAWDNGYVRCIWSGAIFPDAKNPHELQVNLLKNIQEEGT